MLIPINLRPAVRQLREFGVVCAIALPALGWWWGVPAPWLAASAVAGAACAAAAFAAPRLLRPIFVGLAVVTAPIGIVVGELILLAVWWLLFVPLGLVFRLVGRDPLQLRREVGAASYWRPLAGPRDAADYYRQW